LLLKRLESKVENVGSCDCKGICEKDPLKLISPVHMKENAAPYYIANILREAIFRGILAEGEALYQSQLAERLSVSPIPLREALRLLETEGLVDFRGRRGAVVKGLSAEGVQEIYEMMISLETGLLRIAFPSITPEVIEALGRLLDEMDALSDCEALRARNSEFHDSICRPANRPLTLDRIAVLRRQVDRRIRVHMESILGHSREQHYRIFDAIRAKDLTEAVTALTCHLQSVSENLRLLMSRTK
jgi:DNA-binding GntR family transcriptional regulator